MLSGTLVTIIGLMPIGFAKSGVGEYVGIALWAGRSGDTLRAGGPACAGGPGIPF